jgi:hypothetical protein
MAAPVLRATVLGMRFDSIHATSTGLPVLDAQTDFRRARRAYARARLARWLRRCGSCGSMVALSQTTALAAGPSRLEVVPLGAIVGTLEPTTGFDAAFRPASETVRRRWERIALAYRRGDALPPVVLRRQADGYYVVDGRHRVSVARALQHRDINAWVTAPVSARDRGAGAPGQTARAAARRG